MKTLGVRLGFCMTLVLTSVTSAQNGVKLFDFETDADVATWKIRNRGQDTFARSPLFATSGDSSVVFTTPAWKKGMEQWPAFEVRPPVKDWKPFDRLLVDITNPRAERSFLSLFVCDGKRPFRAGLRFSFDLPVHGFKRFVIPLSTFPKAVDRSGIAILHFFAQRPESEMCIYLDNVTLLKRGEKPVAPRGQIVGQIAQLLRERLGPFDKVIAECRQHLADLAGTPALRDRAEKQIAKVSSHLAALGDEMNASGLTLARLAEIEMELTTLPRRCDRLVAAMRLRAASTALGQSTDKLLVGFATSMEKILPRDMPYALAAQKDVAISLARNEKEAFQVAVVADLDPLDCVSVRVGKLTSAGGAVLPAENVDCDVVGFVETRRRPPYEVSYVGWWPDPILDFLGPVDIAAGDVQTFWIRIRAPKEQLPGVYRGTLTVAADGAQPQAFGLTVKIRSFALPDHTPLPTAITFFEHKGKMGGEANWGAMKLRYADFLADYYIDYDSLYRRGPPDFAIVKHLSDRGRLVAFNLGNVFNAGTKAEGFDAAIDKTVARIRPAYEKAKALGLLHHAYIYGFDERPREQFPLLERSARALRAAFPEVLLMTTSYDHSFGLDSVAKTIDAWCPLTPRFDVAWVAKARAAGKKVWWYICCGPRNPHANWFVEYAAIESRLLMGAMTAKYRPDGFLYYSLSIWNHNRPIESGPFTRWNPISWTTYHGDGSLLCSGPGGKPVPTIRLENYRDGMEDFAYACILEEVVRRLRAEPGELSAQQAMLLQEADAALRVPDALVKTMSDYSRDPVKVYAYRNRLGDLIDQLGVPDANPWGDAFGVRGFPTRR